VRFGGERQWITGEVWWREEKRSRLKDQGT